MPRTNLKQEFKQKSPKADIGFSKSYDIVGNIAVIDANPKHAKALAVQVMEANKNVETVLRKGGAISGRFRTRKHIYVMGKRNYVAQYKENNCVFKVDLRKAFFSTRLAFERQRITNVVKDGETVLVMFAGVGPFAIEIAKRNRSSRVIAVELNKDAYNYMRENVLLNKTTNVEAVNEDVKTYSKNNNNIADRIVMPLPMSSYDFLRSAYKSAKKRCTIHYYAFGSKDTAFEDNESLVKQYFSKMKCKTKLLGGRVVRPYSANSIEVVVDFAIRKEE